jgi:hypothetical protein
MKWQRVIPGVLGLFLSLFLSVPATFAVDTNEPALLVSQYKITSGNGQFIELFNNTTEPLDMSHVQLAYYNHYDVTKATSSKLVTLGGSLAPGGYYLVNDGNASLCYQTMVASASLSFSSMAGMVQVHQLTQSIPGGPISSSVVDAASWSKAVVPGIQTLPVSTNAFLQRKWADGEAKISGGGSWLGVQPSAADPCQLESITAAEPVVTAAYTFKPATLPPVRYVVAPSEDTATPNRNVGKMAPLINELLPNPASPQTDAEDEFVELYNPNDSKFDLSGFKLAFGSTSPKKYTFPEGTILEPLSFRAFTSGDTSISLSNTEAQVWLLDPNEQVIGQSDPYVKAPNGQSWALNQGVWAWTAAPSANALNTMSTPAGGSASTTAAVLGISSTPAQTSSQVAASTSAPAAPVQEDAAPLHPSILVGLGILVVGYAIYEYRNDMAHRIFQLRRYVRNRRAARQAV